MRSLYLDFSLKRVCFAKLRNGNMISRKLIELFYDSPQEFFESWVNTSLLIVAQHSTTKHFSAVCNYSGVLENWEFLIEMRDINLPPSSLYCPSFLVTRRRYEPLSHLWNTLNCIGHYSTWSTSQWYKSSLIIETIFKKMRACSYPLQRTYFKCKDDTAWYQKMAPQLEKEKQLSQNFCL